MILKEISKFEQRHFIDVLLPMIYQGYHQVDPHNEGWTLQENIIGVYDNDELQGIFTYQVDGNSAFNITVINFNKPSYAFAKAFLRWANLMETTFEYLELTIQPDSPIVRYLDAMDYEIYNKELDGRLTYVYKQ